jgi:DegV family protein with EDD domain
MSFGILTDVSCDLALDRLDQCGVKCLPQGAVLGSTTYKHYPDEREMPLTEFYRRLRAGEDPHTSGVAVGEWLDVMEDALRENSELLVLPLSSGLSMSCQNAVAAAAEAMKQHTGCRIEVVDTLAGSGGEGLAVLEAARLRDAGLGFDETVAAMQDLAMHIAIWFTVDDLHHLRRGGRVSATTAIVGSALGIKPVLHVNDEGKLVNMHTARGRKKSITALLDHLKETITRPDGFVVISHADCPEEANQLGDDILQTYPEAKLYINTMGPIIGGHTGANAIALSFIASRK